MKGVPFPVTVKKVKNLADTIDLYASSPNKQMDANLMAFFEVMLKHSLYRKVKKNSSLMSIIDS